MIGIIGGGISGLALAWYLQQAGKPYILFEASGKAGGKIRTKYESGLILEEGPNSILCDENCLQLLEATGCMSESLDAKPVSDARFIWKQGKYRQLPSKPQQILTNPFFSWSAKWKILSELLKKPLADHDAKETVADFFIRHFGQEVVDYAVQPFVSGIYAGNAGKLNLDLTFPRLRELEQQHGSVLKGLAKSAGKRKRSLNFKQGMQTLPMAISGKLQHILLEAKVEKILQTESGYQLNYSQLGEIKSMQVDQVVVCTPATDAALLLNDVVPMFAFSLSQISYASVAVVHTQVNQKANIKNRPLGFGGLHPSIETMTSAGSIWNDLVFDGRCNSEQALFTSFISNATQPELPQWNGDKIRSAIWLDLKRGFQIPQTEPDYQNLYYWHEGIPQYESKLRSIWDSANELQTEKLHFLANWKDGVSLSDCINNAKKLAASL